MQGEGGCNRGMELKPVFPFEPISTETLPTGANWIAQIKWDGVRMLTYYNGQEVRLWNRRCHERSAQYLELLDIGSYCTAASVILDGEIIAFDEKRPSFHEIMKRESLRKKQSIERAMNQTPVTYMIFDILMCNGKWLLDQPLSARQQILQEVIRPRTQIQLTPNMPDGNQLYDVMKHHAMEGVGHEGFGQHICVRGEGSTLGQEEDFP